MKRKPGTVLAAIATATAWEIACPSCEESVPALGGSLFWTASELSSQGTRAIDCECGERIRIPRRLTRASL